jgi:hypothetical protein
VASVVPQTLNFFGAGFSPSGIAERRLLIGADSAEQRRGYFEHLSATKVASAGGDSQGELHETHQTALWLQKICIAHNYFLQAGSGGDMGRKANPKARGGTT